MIGKEMRMKRLFRHAKRTFILPMDHGVAMGPIYGITDILPVVRQVGDSVDGVVVHKGMMEQLSEYASEAGWELIMHLSASTSLSPDPDRKELVASVEHAIRMGASAVSVHINLGGKSEALMLKDLGSTAEVCAAWGMPLLAMMYVRDGSKASEFDVMKIKHSARVAEELGADIVKVNYPGTPEGFFEVTGSVKIPVIIAGGPMMGSDSELLTMVSDAVKAGARGVAIGRNIFQHPEPGILAGQIRHILDGNGS